VSVYEGGQKTFSAIFRMIMNVLLEFSEKILRKGGCIWLLCVLKFELIPDTRGNTTSLAYFFSLTFDSS